MTVLVTAAILGLGCGAGEWPLASLVSWVVILVAVLTWDRGPSDGYLTRDTWSAQVAARLVGTSGVVPVHHAVVLHLSRSRRLHMTYVIVDRDARRGAVLVRGDARDRYSIWRNAASACAREMNGWLAAAAPERLSAHARYIAALDREQAAADDLARGASANGQRGDRPGRGPAEAGRVESPHDGCGPSAMISGHPRHRLV